MTWTLVLVVVCCAVGARRAWRERHSPSRVILPLPLDKRGND